MNIGEALLILILFYPIAIIGAQFVTRTLKIKQTPRKIWRFELPTQKEFIYALIATLCLILLMWFQKI